MTYLNTPAFGPALTVGNHLCSCGRPVDEDGACYRCDATEPEADSAPVRTSPYASLPADDPRRFSFDLPAEDNPNPFGFGPGTDRIRSRRGPRVPMGRRA